MLAYLAIGSLAILPIYAGSHATLRRPATAPPPTTKEEEDEEQDLIVESLTSSDAMLFPVIGGVVLFSLYLVIKYVSKEWLNTIFNIYFTVMGLASNTQAFYKVAVYLLPQVRSMPKYEFKIVRKSRSEDNNDAFHTIKISSLYVLLGSLSLVLSIYYSITKNWVVSNIFGLAFAFNGIQLLALDSFRTGMILLSGLFLYDIYFVFGTKVMVTVRGLLYVLNQADVVAGCKRHRGTNKAHLSQGFVEKSFRTCNDVRARRHRDTRGLYRFRTALRPQSIS